MGQCWAKICTTDADEHHNLQLPGSKVQLVITSDRWEQKLLEAKNDGKLVIANFSAPWCTPCKGMLTTYHELADRYPSIMFLTVDVDEMPDFGTSWDIKATPTFFFLTGGQPVDKLVGANKPELEKKVAAFAESRADHT